MNTTADCRLQTPAPRSPESCTPARNVPEHLPTQPRASTWEGKAAGAQQSDARKLALQTARKAILQGRAASCNLWVAWR